MATGDLSGWRQHCETNTLKTARHVILWAVLTHLVFSGAKTDAGLPEPDTILFGTIAIEGRVITADDTDVTVQVRATTNGPVLGEYRIPWGAARRLGIIMCCVSKPNP